MPTDPTRRQLGQALASTLLLPTAIAQAQVAKRQSSQGSVHEPDFITAFTEDSPVPLLRSGAEWSAKDILVRVQEQAFSLRALNTAIRRIRIRWNATATLNALYLGDAWERSYGDLYWQFLNPERAMPWYFLALGKDVTVGYGVKTGGGALAFWQVDPDGITLWFDVRNGGRGVRLGQRELQMGSVVTETYRQVSPFAAAQQFCTRMCNKPRLPAKPVYGGNNWYYAYGNSSAADIRRDSELIASLAPPGDNPPFMVIDDGWSPNDTAGPWRPNAKFGDMAELAAAMKRTGVQPGIWIRPLFTKEKISERWLLHSPNAKREFAERGGFTLDPTVPEVLTQVQADIRQLNRWGFTMIKHDFSTYDLMGRWGFSMGASMTEDGWGFTDGGRTNAEVMRTLYEAIRQAAGDALIIGCNTVGHLGAGLFELQRTGDDTSGRSWDRTRRMGINTLAFRAPQQNTFFAIDADCVGLTRAIDWKMNRQWLDLLARSGCPLFVSAAPDAVGPEQREALQPAFATASKRQTVGEPLDWTSTTQPEKWKFGGRMKSYDWYADAGLDPFSG